METELYGVTILNTIETGGFFRAELFILISFALFIVGFLFLISSKGDSFFLGAAIGCFVLAIIDLTIGINKIGKADYQYQVIFDENILFSEVEERYNIIERDGQIYTIEVKDTYTDAAA